MLTVVGAGGAVASIVAYLTAVDLHVLPGEPLILLYAFALTQVYGLLMVGLQPWLKQFFLPVSMISALILSVPSSGGTVSPDMLPAPFHDLSYVLPLAQTVSITRSVAYFHAAGIAQPTLVLGAWAALPRPPSRARGGGNPAEPEQQRTSTGSRPASVTSVSCQASSRQRRSGGRHDRQAVSAACSHGDRGQDVAAKRPRAPRTSVRRMIF